ncbi:MAG: hypothetical protein PWP65_1758 [Clostridia bacterium]|nr:hypothetical protein [Clostridia bacterium]
MRLDGYISARQATLFIWFTILPTAILFLPQMLAKKSQQDAWLAIILAALPALAVSACVYLLSRRFPRQTLWQMLEFILGRPLGRFFGFLYVWFFLHLNAVVVRQFGEFLTTAVMTETPLLVFAVTITAVSIYAARNGLEVLARAMEFIMPLMVFFMMAVLFLTAPEMSGRHLLPLMSRGWHPVLQGAFLAAGWLGEVVLLAAIVGFINPPEGLRSSILFGLAGTLFFLAAVTIGSIMIFGAAETGRLSFPAYSLARQVSIGEFLERIEVLFMAIWVGGVFIKITILLYVTATGLGTLVGLTDYRPLLLPLGALTVALSVWLHEDVTHLTNYILRVWPSWSLIWEMFLPALFLLLSLILDKKGEGA